MYVHVLSKNFNIINQTISNKKFKLTAVILITIVAFIVLHHHDRINIKYLAKNLNHMKISYSKNHTTISSEILQVKYI